MLTTGAFEPVAGQRVGDLRAELAELDGWERARTGRLRRVLLDTFDWRAHQAGGVVEVDVEGDRTTVGWLDLQTHQLTSRARAQTIPRFAEDLPEGPLRDRLERLLGARALVPIVELDVRRDEFRHLDSRNKTTARILLDHSWMCRGDKTSDMGLELRVAPMRGYERDAVAAGDLLTELGCTTTSAGVEQRAIEAAGHHPGTYSSKLRIRLQPQMPAAAAYREVLARLLDTIEANVDGTRRDLDSEFLHDLRVGVRRSRSVLGRAHRVLPEGVIRAGSSELRWLQSVTSPARDLDVWVLSWPGIVSDAGSDETTLEPVRQLLVRRRLDAHRALNEALGSPRFDRFTSSWRSWLDSGGDGSELGRASEPIASVASEVVSKAIRSVVKHGASIGDDDDGEQLHDLRKRAKRLRYLIECFGSVLSPADAVGPLTKDLKGLQDVLGDFQDTDVQVAMLRELAAELHDAEAPTQTIVAIGTTIARLDDRHQIVRTRYSKQFARFRRSVRKHPINR